MIGKRIVAIQQERFHDPGNGWIVHVRAIVLDDGTELVPMTAQTETDPATYFLVRKAPAK